MVTKQRSKLDELVAGLRAARGAALLAAGGITRMAACRLTPDERAPFDDLHAALRGWLPQGEPCSGDALRTINAIYDAHFPRCLAVDIHYNSRRHPSRMACSGAYLQFYALLPMVGRGLPADGFYDMTPDTFVEIATQASRGWTSPTVLIRRFERLLAAAARPWHEQCALADRIPWELRCVEAAMPLRLGTAAAHLAAGSEWRWRVLSGHEFLEVDADAGTIALRLSVAERAELAAVFPFLAS